MNLDFKQIMNNLHTVHPLIHNITNYVTVNDCANILLACGASPIMSDDIQEAEEITSICTGLNINIGTLNQNTIPSMFLAGKKANLLSHPIILDPVGAGASSLRTNTANNLLKEVHFSVIKGNISEIKALALGANSTKGVDADKEDNITEDSLSSVIKLAESFSQETNAIIAITGPIDIISSSNQTYIVRNGHPVMSKITGCGCMLTAMTAAYISANPDNMLTAVTASFCSMGVAGELAYKRMEKNKAGNSSFCTYLIDEIYNLSPEKLETYAKYAFFTK